LLKYKIPFNKELFIKQTKLTLPYIYSKQYRKVKESAIFSISIISIGIIILSLGSELSTLFFVISVFGFYSLYINDENYKRIKNNHIRVVKEYLDKTIITSVGFFEFRDDCLRFSNDYLCTWIYWGEFESYKIKKSNLLLIQKEIKDEVLVIAESEVNKSEFLKIINFVQSKVK